MSLSPAAQRVRDTANARIGEIARHLFGPPKRGGRRGVLRYPGGLQVDTAGRYAGRFRVWGTAEHGDGIGCFRFAHHCDFPAALALAAEYLGLPLDDAKPPPRARRRELKARQHQRRREWAAADERDRAERIGVARAIWEASEAIAGTLGERYLTETRGIPVPAAGWPRDAIRYHAGDRAVVFAATTDDGEVQATHSVYLTGAAQNQRRADGSKIKITHGVLAGAVVRLPGPIGAPLLIAEGVETGLSGWRATGYATWILLGALAGAKPPHGRIVIGLRDDDAPGSPADQALEKSLAAWRKDSVRLICATPWPERRGDKSDFNDRLRSHGLDAVRRRIRLAELAAHGLAPAAPPFALPTATAAELRTDIGRTITGFFARRWDDAKPRILLSTATGAGKTELVGKRLPAIIEVDTANRRPHRIIIAVPAHKLARQIAKRYAAPNLAVAVYEGRGDPWTPPPPGRDYLCQDLAAVGLALSAGADITKAVCGSAKSETRCRFRDGCAYYAQLERAKAADVLLVAHNFVFEPLPQTLLDNVGAVIVEEDFTAHGIGTVELPIAAFDDKALWLYPVRAKDGAADHRETSRLDDFYRRIEGALKSSAGGQPLAAALAAAELSTKDIAQARGLTWRRKVDDDMRPGMPLDDRRAASLAAAKINPVLPRIAAVLHALEDVAQKTNLSGLDADAPPIAIEGGTVTVHRLREPAKWLASLPVLIASASVRPDLARRFFPGLDHAAPPQPALPHQTVRQYLGAFGKAALGGAKLAQLVTQIRFEAVLGRSVLVICHMQVEDAFRHIPGVRTLHHGNVAGDDDFGDVDLIVQIGGPFAPPAEIARLASAEAGRLVSLERPVRAPCVALMADGTGVQFERLAYQDPAAQQVHEGIYDQSFVQGGLGRGRGINRSAATPLEIHILGNVPLPVPVAAIERWRRPSALAKMFLGGNLCLNAHDMHRFHPDLFRSPAAAAQAKHRWGGEGEIRAEGRRLARRWREPMVEVTWQPIGQGHKARTNIVERARLDAVRGEALRHFPAGLAAWKVAPLTAAAHPLGAANECDITGKRTLFPTMSDSSTASKPTLRAPGAAAHPHWPPDG